MRVVRWAAAVFLVLYLVFAPAIIKKGLARDPYYDWLEPEKPAWRGRITLWHIAEFRTYQGSVTRHLAERAEAYCKAHPGVHIEVTGMTRAQYDARIARGAFPDAYSFQAGLLYAEQLRPIEYELPALSGALRTACADGETYAVPYLMSGYFLTANVQLLARYHTDLPETPDAAFLQSALALSPDAPQLVMEPVGAALCGLVGTLAEPDAFSKGRATLAQLDARALGDLHRGNSTLSVEAVAFSPWSDQVQYLGASRGTDDARAAIVADFAAFLLSPAEQERLASLGALPVTADAAPVYAERALTALFTLRESMKTPDPFSYQRHKDALLSDAQAALAGDAAAKKSFFERLQVVESGEL